MIVNERIDWTVTELAEYLDVDTSYIRAEIRRGKLTGVKRGGIWLISDGIVQEWLSNRKSYHKKVD